MKKVAVLLASFLVANVAMAGAVEKVSYQCLAKKRVAVTYNFGSDVATAKVKLDGRMRTLRYTANTDGEGGVFKDDRYSLHVTDIKDMRQSDGMMIFKEGNAIVNGQKTPVSKILYKDCAPR